MANNEGLIFAALAAAKHAADGVPDAVADWLSEHVDPETGYVVDDTLSIEGAAADAKAVGDRFESAGLTDAVKQALLQLASKVAYIDDDGQDYYDDLYAALYNGEYWTVTNTLTGCTTSNPAASVTKDTAYSATITASSGYTLTGATVSITMGGTDITSTAYNNGTISIASVTGALVISITAVAEAKTLSSISAVYTQSGTVYYTDSLDSLKSDLVVTATYSDSSTATVPSADYTLSGTLAVGTSTITVSYGGQTTTFNVTVSTGFRYVPSMGVLSNQAFLNVSGELDVSESVSNGVLNLTYPKGGNTKQKLYVVKPEYYGNASGITGLYVKLRIKILDMSWFASDNEGGTGYFYILKFSTDSGGMDLGFARYNGTSADPRLRYRSSAATQVWDDTPISLNTWHTFTFHVDNGNQIITMDGAEILNTATGGNHVSTNEMRIGVVDGKSNNFSVQIEEIEVRYTS